MILKQVSGLAQNVTHFPPHASQVADHGQTTSRSRLIRRTRYKTTLAVAPNLLFLSRFQLPSTNLPSSTITTPIENSHYCMKVASSLRRPQRPFYSFPYLPYTAAFFFSQWQNPRLVTKVRRSFQERVAQMFCLSNPGRDSRFACCNRD